MLPFDEFERSNVANKQKICDILKCLELSPTAIDRIKRTFEEEMDQALQMRCSSLQMENTYIPELPDGKEEGSYLAMDLGGTNLRVMLIVLEQGKVVQEKVKYYHIQNELRMGCGTRLFDFLAECVVAFTVENQLDGAITYPMGFTFSFPMQQRSLDSGILVTWTKEFNCPSVVGQDAVEMLRTALSKKHCTNINVVAILNDTTGTLMHGALIDKETRIGIVLGTGSNGCFMEKADRVQHWEQKRNAEDHVVIDIEWGAFGDNGVLDFIKSDFDREVDNTSASRNSFTFEKYIGGKYLGEICRVVLKCLHTNNLFLSQLPAENIPQPWTFNSHNISIIEHDTLHNRFENVEVVLKEHFKTDNYTEDDLHTIRCVCGLISLRAAQLVAINTSTLLGRMEEDRITIAVDGSVYKHHPRLRHWIAEYTQLWAPHKKSTFILAEDGSGKGAALVAAIAERIQKRDL